RLAMVTLALAHPCSGNHQPASPDPRFAVTSLDAPHPAAAPNYTVNLLEELTRTMPAATLFAIAGADSFLSLPQWRSPERVLALAEWIVVSRPGLPLTRTIKPAFLARPEFSPLALTPDQRARIHLLPDIHEDISATTLRTCLQDPATESDRNAALDQWVPSAVAAYIREHHLYRL